MTTHDVIRVRGARTNNLRGIDIDTVPLREATSDLKAVPQSRWDEAAVLFG